MDVDANSILEFLYSNTLLLRLSDKFSVMVTELLQFLYYFWYEI